MVVAVSLAGVWLFVAGGLIAPARDETTLIPTTM